MNDDPLDHAEQSKPAVGDQAMSAAKTKRVRLINQPPPAPGAAFPAGPPRSPPGNRPPPSSATSRLDPYILRWKGDATDPSKADVALLRTHYAKGGLRLVRDAVGLRLESQR